MSEDEVLRGVVDRVEGDVAVVLVGDNERELVLPRSALPAGASEGAWLLVREADGELVVVGTDPEGEAQQRKRIYERLEQLRRRRRRFR